MKIKIKTFSLIKRVVAINSKSYYVLRSDDKNSISFYSGNSFGSHLLLGNNLELIVRINYTVYQINLWK
jgi:hypothetical protein